MYNYKTDSPCFNCKNRSAECHGKCEKFSNYLKVHEEEKKKNQDSDFSRIANYDIKSLFESRKGKRYFWGKFNGRRF